MGKVIIGLGYKARCGKDTVAAWLVENHGFSRLAFADSLKGACRAIFHLDDRHLYGDLKEQVHEFWGTTPRDILQRVGTEAMRRGFDPDIWIKSVEWKIMAPGSPDLWVIPDVRFPNEAEAIKRWGGEVWRIDRPGIENAIATASHTSETSMDSYQGWTGIMVNNGTIEDLYETAGRRLHGIPR